MKNVNVLQTHSSLETFLVYARMIYEVEKDRITHFALTLLKHYLIIFTNVLNIL